MLSILKLLFFLNKIVSILSSFNPATLTQFNSSSLLTSIFLDFYEKNN